MGHTTTYTFDSMNRITAITGPDPDGSGPASASVTYIGYDAAGRATSQTDPIGRVTTQTFNAAGEMTQRAIGSSYVENYEYDGAGELVRTLGPPPDASDPGTRMVTNYGYNLRGQVVDITDSVHREQRFSYNCLLQCDWYT
jgi:YD repeat-containing protein